MSGDYYIAAVPRKKFQFRLKQTAYPKDIIIFTGSKYRCEMEKKRLLDERLNKNRTQ